MKKQHIIQQVVLCAVISIMTTSCNLSGVRRIDVVDVNSNPINNIIVVPVSDSQSFGARRLLVCKPFIFNSGDDIIQPETQHKGVIVGPGLALGKPDSISAWIFLKSGYSPLRVPAGTIQSNSYVVEPDPDDDPLVLQYGRRNEYLEVINVLIKLKQPLYPRQIKLRDQLGLTYAKIEPDAKDFLEDVANK